MKKMVQHKGLKFTFRGYKYRPDGTVFVVKEGSVLEDVVIPRGLGGELDLGDWTWGTDSYFKEWDLPQFEGLALDGRKTTAPCPFVRPARRWPSKVRVPIGHRHLLPPIAALQVRR
jgi:hypothetical protein